MALITNPSDLIQLYLNNSGATKMPVPTGMGDMRENLLKATYAPDYFSKSRANIVGEPGPIAKPVEHKPLAMPDPLKPKMEAPTEEAWAKPGALEEQMSAANAKARDDARKAREAEAAKAAGAVPTTPGVTTGVTTTPEPHQFEGQHTVNTNAPKDAGEFYTMIRPHADKIAQETGLDVNLVMAKIALETGYGKHAPGFNYFGIKETDPKKGQLLDTQEMVDGKMVPQKARFRSYANIGESVTDYIKFLKENGRYADLLKAKGLEAQLEALQKSGYATDSGYAAKLRGIIKGIPQTKLPTVSPTPGVVNTPDPPSEPGTRVGEHRSGWFWNGTSWDKAYARGGHIKDLLALSRNYR